MPHGPDPRSPRPASLPKPRDVRHRLSNAALRLSNRLSGLHAIQLEYPPPTIDPVARANPAIERLLDTRAGRFRDIVAAIESYGADLRSISGVPTAGNEPHWDQHWFTGIDAAVLYAFVRDRRPRTYYEVGSGNSTLFAARAVRDGELDTRVVAVDPEPRAEIDAVCSEVVRRPFQDCDPGVLQSLQSGDIVLIDSSHYALTRSDVVAFLLEGLPRTRAGVLVGVHDIFLPDDYPWWLEDRWYSEQYLLAAWLLGARDNANVQFAAHYVATRTDLRSLMDAAWQRIGLSELVAAYGSSFWFETT